MECCRIVALSDWRKLALGFLEEADGARVRLIPRRAVLYMMPDETR